MTDDKCEYNKSGKCDLLTHYVRPIIHLFLDAQLSLYFCHIFRFMVDFPRPKPPTNVSSEGEVRVVLHITVPDRLSSIWNLVHDDVQVYRLI
jgi:hypothetical protein